MGIDDTDQAILYLLQAETRTDATHDEIAERIGVSSSTVSNRLQRLRDTGVLEACEPVIDYEAAGAPHHLLFVCTAPIAEREQLCERAIQVSTVVHARELLTGTRNVHVEVVGRNANDVETATEELDAIGLEIDAAELLRSEYSRPFDYFGSAVDNGSSLE
ncbi:Lrp/AsnC family transcriptional regulator [Natrinema sp. 1APR25-10V2]|uniref:Lrp/AsnC family transcriptional regulator n=1 Tax=Natrinema sp. 1APR25-10V2 TaxID=2951081 RepID=UPI00287540BD|nr:Lrp/AsnC family transcriptional regulator [Natrinema sp. 1APR25-10V2]MDS0476444.1 Lrp/AsnC family transcriptional regulator [Natrinema sp. 1APR25-10V2]